MSVYQAYCEKCLKQPTKADKEFYDFRFDDPVCIKCVEELGLEPDEDLDEDQDPESEFA